MDVSYTVTGRFLRYLSGEMTHADKKITLIHFGSNLAVIQIWIRMNTAIGLESRITFWPWRTLCCLTAVVVLVVVHYNCFYTLS